MIQVVEKPIVKKITLELGGKEIELSLEDARNLHKALAELLNEPKITVTPYPSWGWTWYPYQPQSGTITWTGINGIGASTSVYANQTNSLLQ